MTTASPYDDFLRNRIVDALASHGADETNADIEALLDAAEPTAVTEADVDRILARAFAQLADSKTETPGETPATLMATRTLMATETTDHLAGQRVKPAGAIVFLALASVTAVVGLFWGGGPQDTASPDSLAKAGNRGAENSLITIGTPLQEPSVDWNGLFAKTRPDAEIPQRTHVGDRIETGDRERRRVTLPDGSVLYVNENTQVSVTASRRIRVHTGDVFVEVVPKELVASKQPFVVAMPGRRVTALGTRFAVSTGPRKGGVLVTQGKVKVSGLEQPLIAGQELAIGEGVPGPVFDTSAGVLRPAPRASEALDWTRDLMAKAENDLVPESDHRGGAVVVVDTHGQPSKLSLRKFHVDVHIEDGFARTTIDQTYFNHENRRLEGTFYFPLPTDASLSRLAMYVNGTLMEGGMLERDRARDVFEQIRHTRRDPALLEWVDGSTFKMRVFPLEARQEKRIVLSYTQRLPNDYGRIEYRFPAGHNLELVRDWSTRIRVADGQELKWDSPSHVLKASTEENDLILEGQELKSTFDRDLVLELRDRNVKRDGVKSGIGARFASVVHGQHRYFMIRYLPQLQGELRRKSRNWVFLFEASGNRDPLLARVQIDVVKTLLENAEHTDTFSIVRAATRVKSFKSKPVRCTRKNIRQAVKYLEAAHLIGAFDFGKALDACVPFHEAGKDAETHLVHVGSAVPVVGDRDEQKLVNRIPKSLRYVGVGVGKRWSRQFMKMAAMRTGGYFTQVNPDEKVTWRAFELFSTLNAPRLLNAQLRDAAKRFEFLAVNDAISQGQELCAIARLPMDTELPETLVVTGTLRGEAFRQEITVANVATKANYLPRTWTRLEIDRLVADGSEKNKAAIVKLSKAMYVMSPFTSLLVLENEAMYAQFKVDRGRDDHWALYPAPKKIEVVHEPLKYGVKLTDVRQGLVRELQEQESEVELLKEQYESALTKNGQYEVERRRKKFLALKRELQRTRTRLKFTENSEAFVDDIRENAVVYRQANRSTRPVHTVMSKGYLAHWGWQPDLSFTRQQRQIQLLSRQNSAQFFDGESPESEDLSRRIAMYEMAFRMQPNPLTLSQDLDVRRNIVDLPSVKLQREIGQVTRLVAPLRFLGTDSLSVSSIGRGLNDVRLSYQYETAGSRVRLWDRGFQQPLRGVDAGLNFTVDEAFRGSARRSQSFTIPSTTSTGYVNGNIPLGWAMQPLNWDVDGWSNLRFYPPIDTTSRSRRFRAHGTEFETVNGREINLWWQYNRQYILVSGTPDVFGDLVSHAPGMESSTADALAVLAAQQDKPPVNGDVDPAAAKLIEQARQTGWESIEIPGGQGRPSFIIDCDGHGRMEFERTVSEGLIEQVVNDGDSLWHIYPDLKIGAKRAVSRFHRASLQTLVPWLLEPVADLRVDAHVRLFDADTVSIEPIEAGQRFMAVRLKFRNGRLVRRSLVDMPSGKALLSVSYSPEGTVVVRDSENAEVRRIAYRRSESKAPSQVPATDGILVLPLPYRPIENNKALVDFSKALPQQLTSLTDEQFLRVFADAYASQSPYLVQMAYSARASKMNKHLGLKVLLVSSQPRVATAQPVAKYASEGLSVFLGQLRDWKLQRNINKEFVLPKNSPKFLLRLAQAQNLSNRWASQEPLHDRTSAQIQTEVTRAFDVIAGCTSPFLALQLLESVHRQITAAPKTSPMLTALMAERSRELVNKFDDLGPLVDRHAYWLFRNGKAEDAASVYETRIAAALSQGVTVSLNAEVREQFRKFDSVNERWTKLVLSVFDKYRRRDARTAVLEVALQSHRLGDADLATVGYEVAVNGMSLKEHPELLARCLAFHRELKQWESANELFETLVELDTYSKNFALWRSGAHLAHLSGNLELEVRRLERSVELEYTSWPEKVELQLVRQRFGELLDKFTALAKSTSKQLPMDAVSRIIRIADRWRTLDPDVTAACQKAASALDAGGYQDFAWDYWTTPLADKPNEASAWLELARNLQQSARVDLADRAFEEAFAAEPTNGQILWEHADMLRQAKKTQKSTAVLTRLANGTWQPRFRNIQSRARQSIEESDR